ncbi:hypothetical protein D3C73_1429820 [compost metagenome]
MKRSGLPLGVSVGKPGAAAFAGAVRDWVVYHCPALQPLTVLSVVVTAAGAVRVLHPALTAPL